MKTDLFKILNKKINGKKLAYLDNAATTQRPESVIKVLGDFYRNSNANIHRGIHTLSEEATEKYEQARDVVKNYIGAKNHEEIIFTRGTTESINLIASTWGEKNIKKGDEIILTEMEHHANLVPWQILAKKKKAKIKFIPIDKTGRLVLKNLNKLIGPRSKLISITHASNVLGTINPIKQITKAAKKKNIIVVIDGAQAIAHEKINVADIDCDFYAFSGHKMYGPTGIGVLYGKKHLLENMIPYQTGGGMIRKVTLKEATFAPLPDKFEAGTPNIAGAIGLGEAINFIKTIGLKKIIKKEKSIKNYALRELKKIPEVTIYGPAEGAPVISFTIKGVPVHDLATILDREGVAIRVGHHCAMPLHTKLGIPSSARASFALYNTEKDIEALIQGIKKSINFFYEK